MANYRNRYLEFVKKNYSNYDYMLVVDLDIDGSMSIKKFLRKVLVLIQFLHKGK